MNAFSKKQISSSIFMSILINGIIPLCIYNTLSPHLSNKSALIVATIVPLLDNLRHLLKEKKADAFALFMLMGFILSIVALFLGGNEKVILLRESFVTAIMGVVFLVTLVLKRPLIYHFAIRFSNQDLEARKSLFEKLWLEPYFRKTMRTMTAVWGVAMLLEATIKVVMVIQLTIPEFLFFSQFVFYGVMGSTIAWTVAYKRHASKQMRVRTQAQ